MDSSIRDHEYRRMTVRRWRTLGLASPAPPLVTSGSSSSTGAPRNEDRLLSDLA